MNVRGGVVRVFVLIAAGAAAVCTHQAAAQAAAERTLPARPLPTPTTVSPELQAWIARPWKGSGAPVERTAEQWKAYVAAANALEEKEVDPLLKKFHATVEPGNVAGVPVFWVKPEEISEANRGRLLVHVHGGAYVIYGGRAGLPEAILMAHATGMEVVSVDYRMPPDFPFPAAVDDTVAVWKELTKTHTPRSVGLFGTSAGGGLTLATVLRLKEMGLPLPGVLMAGTPWADLTKTGDTYFTNELVDNVLGTNDGNLEASAKLYAGTHDLKEPLLSPVYGDLKGFPPTILISGTRDLFLSNTVRVHQKLLLAGVDASLLVFEGQSHAQYLLASDSQESMAALEEVARFMDLHLDR